METPDEEPPSLEEGVEEEVWIKMKKTEELKAEYHKKIEELDKMGEQAISQADADLEEVYRAQLADFGDGPKKVSHQQISDIVDALVKASVDSCTVTLTHSFLRQNLDLEFRIEQLEMLLAPSRKEAHSNLSSSLRSSGNSSKMN